MVHRPCHHEDVFFFFFFASAAAISASETSSGRDRRAATAALALRSRSRRKAFIASVALLCPPNDTRFGAPRATKDERGAYVTVTSFRGFVVCVCSRLGSAFLSPDEGSFPRASSSDTAASFGSATQRSAAFFASACASAFAVAFASVSRSCARCMNCVVGVTRGGSGGVSGGETREAAVPSEEETRAWRDWRRAGATRETLRSANLESLHPGRQRRHGGRRGLSQAARDGEWRPGPAHRRTRRTPTFWSVDSRLSFDHDSFKIQIKRAPRHFSCMLGRGVLCAFPVRFLPRTAPVPKLTRRMSVGADANQPEVHASKMARVEDTLRVKKISEHAVLPVRGSEGAAGYDLAAAYECGTSPMRVSSPRARRGRDTARPSPRRREIVRRQLGRFQTAAFSDARTTERRTLHEPSFRSR
jgi:hypothetical protein